MVDSVGKFSVGKSAMVGSKRKNFLLRTIQKSKQWRDNARMNLFQQRRRYKLKVEANRALMKAKKAGKLPNLNPSSCLSRLHEDGLQPKSIHRFQATHSTVPAKPKYSIVKPAKRIYGNRWIKLERDGKLNTFAVVKPAKTTLPAKLVKSKHTIIRSKERIYDKGAD